MWNSALRNYYVEREGTRLEAGISMFSSPSVRVRMYQSGFQWSDFRGNWWWERLRKSDEKLQMCIKCDKNIRDFT